MQRSIETNKLNLFDNQNQNRVKNSRINDKVLLATQKVSLKSCERIIRNRSGQVQVDEDQAKLEVVQRKS